MASGVSGGVDDQGGKVDVVGGGDSAVSFVGGGLQELRRKQATAVVLLAVIGAEFGQEISASAPALSGSISAAHPAGFTQTDYSLARATSSSLLCALSVSSVLPCVCPKTLETNLRFLSCGK